MLNNCVCGLSCFHICSTNFFTHLWLRSVTPEVNISPGCYQLVKRSKQCFLPPSQVYYLSSLNPSCLCATGLWSSTLEWSITADHWSRTASLAFMSCDSLWGLVQCLSKCLACWLSLQKRRDRCCEHRDCWIRFFHRGEHGSVLHQEKN